MTQVTPITDYDDNDYEDGFWSVRSYENDIEQFVLSKLVPKSAHAFLDVGGGFGRLIPAYQGVVKNSITLFDYSEKLLASARKKYAEDKRFKAVQGNFYEMPFEKESFDAGCSVRVIHHVENVDQYFSEIARVLKSNSYFVLEYANKRNTLEILRWVLRRTTINPFSVQPENRSEKGLTYNFHPRYINLMLRKHGLKVEKKVASSLFRLGFLKRLIGQQRLARLENAIPFWLRVGTLSPSIFLKLRKSN